MKIIIFAPTSTDINNKILGGADQQLKKLFQVLKKQAHKTTLYTSTKINKLGIYNFMEAYKQKLECDLLIVYRKAIVLPNIKTKYKIFYSQDRVDTPCFDSIREHPKYLEQFDKIICLSNNHAEHLKQELGLTQTITIIGNSTEKVKQSKQKTQDFIYCSAPHKALIPLALIWKQLSPLYPKSKLHIYSSYKLYGNKELDKKYKNFEKIKKLKNVVWHGAKNRKEMLKQLNKSKLMLAPHTYPETYGNVFNEAKSYLVPVITTDIGSAKEVLDKNGITIKGNAYSEKYQQKFLTEVVACMESIFYYRNLQRVSRYRTHKDYEKDIIKLIKGVEKNV